MLNHKCMQSWQSRNMKLFPSFHPCLQCIHWWNFWITVTRVHHYFKNKQNHMFQDKKYWCQLNWALEMGKRLSGAWSKALLCKQKSWRLQYAATILFTVSTFHESCYFRSKRNTARTLPEYHIIFFPLDLSRSLQTIFQKSTPTRTKVCKVF